MGSRDTDCISELNGVAEIAGDGIAQVFCIDHVLRFIVWEWQMNDCGILHRVLSGRVRLAQAGAEAGRPLITRALEGKVPSLATIKPVNAVNH